MTADGSRLFVANAGNNAVAVLTNGTEDGAAMATARLFPHGLVSGGARAASGSSVGGQHQGLWIVR